MTLNPPNSSRYCASRCLTSPLLIGGSFGRQEERDVKAKGLLVIAIVSLLGCATTSASSTTASPSADGEGLSCERRVKVAAIPEEYAWVKAHYPGAKVKMQSLSDCGGSPTDELDIVTTDGRSLTTYFDISSFF
jgi:hypothetical protein